MSFYAPFIQNFRLFLCMCIHFKFFLKGKLEEEQKLRAKIEFQLDTHNKKVKEISGVMDTVEREMEKRDANIVDLEGQVHVEKSKIESLEAELQKATKIIDSQKNELLAARQSQKNLVQHCEHVEAESRELQEFLQVRSKIQKH